MPSDPGPELCVETVSCRGVKPANGAGTQLDIDAVAILGESRTSLWCVWCREICHGGAGTLTCVAILSRDNRLIVVVKTASRTNLIYRPSDKRSIRSGFSRGALDSSTTNAFRLQTTRRMTVPRSLRWMRTVFGLTGLAFLVATVVATARNSEIGVVPSWRTLGIAAAVLLAALVTNARAWTALFEQPNAAGDLRRAFYAAQLGKYIPGGIWHLMAQATLSTGSGVSAKRAAALVPLHLYTQVCAAAVVVASWGILAPRTPILWRTAAIVTLVLVAFLRRRWLAAFLRAVLPRIARNKDAEFAVPQQSSILRSTAWTVVTLLLSGVAFAVLLSDGGSDAANHVVVLSFSVAWLAGFVAIPVPAGLGVREAILVLILAAPTPSVVVASIVHRLVLMCAEALLAVLAYLRRPRESQPSDR